MTDNEAIERLLAEHERAETITPQGWFLCNCLDPSMELTGAQVWAKDNRAKHRAHVAAEIAALAGAGAQVTEAAVRALAIHLFRVDRDRKGLTPVDWEYANDYEQAFFTAEAKAALSAVRPHMGTGQSEADLRARIAELEANLQRSHEAVHLWEKADADLRARINALADEIDAALEKYPKAKGRKDAAWVRDELLELLDLLDRPAAEGDNA